MNKCVSGDLRSVQIKFKNLDGPPYMKLAPSLLPLQTNSLFGKPQTWELWLKSVHYALFIQSLCWLDATDQGQWSSTHHSCSITFMFYKICHNLVNISFPADVKENPHPTRSNPHKYKQLQCNVLAFTYSFFPRSIRTWNSLPVSVSSANRLQDKFKSASVCTLY